MICDSIKPYTLDGEGEPLAVEKAKNKDELLEEEMFFWSRVGEEVRVRSSLQTSNKWTLMDSNGL